jgi:hypothetical protein
MNRSIQYGIVIAAVLTVMIQMSDAGSWGRSVTIQDQQGTTHRRISGTYGETYYRKVQTTYNNGLTTHVITLTNPDGTSHTRTVTVATN